MELGDLVKRKVSMHLQSEREFEDFLKDRPYAVT